MPQIIVPDDGYPRRLPTYSDLPMTVVIDATSSWSFAQLWGLTLLERNLRLVERLGAQSIHLILARDQCAAAAKRKFAGLVEAVLHTSENNVAASVQNIVRHTPGPTLLLSGHGVYDRRFISVLWQHPAPATGTVANAKLPVLALLTDAASIFVRENGTYIEDVQTTPNSEVLSVDIGSIEDRIILLRKSLKPTVLVVNSEASLARAHKYLRDLTGKGVNDLMGEFVHPPIEFFLTRLVARTCITPNQISYTIIALSVTSLPLFATGRLWEGVLLNLFRGVLDGVDGKLARLTLRETKGGNLLDHGTDTIYLPLLFGTFGWHLAGGNFIAPAAIASYILHFFYWCNRILSSWYGLFLGQSDSDFKPIDRLVRRFHPKRNVFVLMLLLALICDNPALALYGITSLTVGMSIFRTARLDWEGRRLHKLNSAGSGNGIR